MTTRFWSRGEAGMLLGRELNPYKRQPGLVVLALPRGALPVGFEVARALDAPLDVLVVRKLGLPGYPELAMGALAGGGVQVLNTDMIREFGISRALVGRVVSAEQAELTRREHVYRGWTPQLNLTGCTVLLVDDGLATGATMRAAVIAARQRGAKYIVVGAPVGTRDACGMLRQVADEVVCLRTPEPFNSVGCWYDQFPQLTDNEVRDTLQRARRVEPVASLTEPALAGW